MDVSAALNASTLASSSSSAFAAASLIAIALAKSCCHESSISLSMFVKCLLVLNDSMELLHIGQLEPLVLRRPSKQSACISCSQAGSFVSPPEPPFDVSPQFNAHGQIET